MIDLYCANGRCPVCDGTMYNQIRHAYKCSNGCCAYYHGVQNYWFGICGEEVEIQVPLERLSEDWRPTEEMLQPVVNLINYWRQDERYLMRILVNSL